MSMYRQYEDPKALEIALEAAKYDLEDYQASFRGSIHKPDLDTLVSLHETIDDLKERINFAYQDEEFEESEAEYASFLGEI